MGRARDSATFTAVATVSLVLASSSAGNAKTVVRWTQFAHVAGVVDVAGPRSDGRLVVASHQGLFLLRRGGALTPFARGSRGYAGTAGEPYIAVARRKRVPRANCSFRRDDTYALEPTAQPGITLIDRSGKARRFFDLPAGAFPSAIAFDTVGRFGYRLLVAALINNRTTLYAVDCRGHARVIVRDAPKVEGGAAVAPSVFGRFAGQFIVPDEFSGLVYAFGAGGHVRIVARPTLAKGQDIGVESVGFVPVDFTRRGAAYLADLGAPGSPTQGSDNVLSLSGRALMQVGSRPSDLLVATEGSGVTLLIRCRRGCVTRRIGRALDATHGEGHIAFSPG